MFKLSSCGLAQAACNKSVAETQQRMEKQIVRRTWHGRVPVSVEAGSVSLAVNSIGCSRQQRIDCEVLATMVIVWVACVLPHTG
jgi:t-SNARE complex subunit (syntaxin)